MLWMLPQLKRISTGEHLYFSISDLRLASVSNESLKDLYFFVSLQDLLIANFGNFIFIALLTGLFIAMDLVGSFCFSFSDLCCKGPCIKYVEEGPEDFCGGHILMSHELYFKIFDGPQNIFLYSIFVILSFQLRGLEHKISRLAIKEI